MPQVRPEEVPGLLDAISREKLSREACFVPVTESIGPFEVCPMTVQQWTILKIARSPLLYGETPSPESLAQFLWILNPSWNSKGMGRKSFMARCRRCFIPPKPPRWRNRLSMSFWTKRHARSLMRAIDTIAAARKYVFDTFSDANMGNDAGGWKPSYYSDTAFLCVALGSEFGYSVNTVLAMPLKQVFQLLRGIKEFNGGGPLGNQSDRILLDHYCAKN